MSNCIVPESEQCAHSSRSKSRERSAIPDALLVIVSRIVFNNYIAMRAHVPAVLLLTYLGNECRGGSPDKRGPCVRQPSLEEAHVFIWRAELLSSESEQRE